MRRSNRNSWFAAATIALILVFSTGCPSDPQDVGYDNDADAGDVSDVSDVSDGNDNDTDASVLPDSKCIVPGEMSLFEAVDSGCERIEIDDTVGLDDIGATDGPIEIDSDLVIEAVGDTPHTIEVPAQGLFEAIDAGNLTLRDLVITGSAADALERPVVHINSEASVELYHVEFVNYENREASIVSIQGAEYATFVDTQIRNTTINGDGPAALDCADSEIELVDGSAIVENSVKVFIEILDSDIRYQAAGVGLQNCSFIVDGSEIRDNGIAVEIEEFQDTSQVYEVTLKGGGVYAVDSQLIVESGSTIAGNYIDFQATNDKSDNVELSWEMSGAGVDATNSSLQLIESTVEANGVDIMIAGNYRHLGSRYIYGAGLAMEGDAEDSSLQIKASTIALNYITLTPSSEHESVWPSMRGAGVFFSSSDAAQLQMINSTISGNVLKNGIDAEGAGAYIEGPASAAGTGGILPIDVSDLFDDEVLTAAIRYSTIADNAIENASHSAKGVGLYIGDIAHTPGSNDQSSEGPVVSVIGLLLNDNVRSDSQSEEEIIDCGGAFNIGEIDEGGGSDHEGFEWGSGYNLVSIAVQGTGSPQSDCFEQLGGSGMVAQNDANLKELVDVLDDGQPKVHEPSSNGPAIDGGEHGRCSGLDTSNILDVDQLGRLRPTGTGCDIGSVEHH